MWYYEYRSGFVGCAVENELEYAKPRSRAFSPAILLICASLVGCGFALTLCGFFPSFVPASIIADWNFYNWWAWGPILVIISSVLIAVIGVRRRET